ncbi:MAG: FadR family transcriptional regulator [Desulfohalobiaceae bacterium]|nr:FadR family transcriptional regulator [Desulfohalobiaceae bacterium]
MRQGQLKPGDRLLSERELCSQLGVSRSSLREALRALEIFGITSSVPGQGSFVMSPKFTSLASFFEMMLYLNKSISENVLEVRMLLECEAVRLAARRATPEELSSLKTVIERMPISLESEDFGAQADFEFHTMIMQATHNDIIIFISEAIEGLLRQSHYERRVALFRCEKKIRDQLITVHWDVYEAMQSGDPNLAADKMREHFRFTNKLLEDQGKIVPSPDLEFG